MSAPIVIVGAGQAAASLASRHIALGNPQPLLLIGDEATPPYQRPPLSKKYLLGSLERERLFIRPVEWYAEHDIETRFKTRVNAINRARKQVTTDDGQTIDYDKLVLCTGSRARNIPASIGGDLNGVYRLRDIDDIDRMAPRFSAGRQLLIIGGGYIGLEAAAAARTLGLEVTLIEMAERIMQRVAAPATADYFRELHRSHGVDLRESISITRLLEKNGQVCGAELESGEQIDADLALIGIGGSPNTELAEAAGLDCNNGICIDLHCRTSDPEIYAAGDCTNFAYQGRNIRLESVQNAADQGDLIARILSGEDLCYHPLPWFWSDQYDCKLQIVGLNQGYTHTVQRTGSSPHSQSVWYYAEDRLLAIDAINEPKSYAFGRMIIDKGKHPAPEVVADPDTDLKAIAKG